jgi:nitrite reductase/ring-hydroxylating ferredoxin subunit
VKTRRKLITLEELKQQRSFRFSYEEEGIQRDGFLAWVDGQVVAYENICRHLPLSLDYGDGRFFTPDGKQFVCHTHGAVYEPLTGLCVAGPCAGASLKKLEVEVIDGEVWLAADNQA